jgi:chromosome segregation ATPase
MSATGVPERSDPGDERQELLRRVAVAESELRASHERESELGRALADSEAELAALVAERAAAAAEREALRAEIEELRADAEQAARSQSRLEEQAARSQSRLEEQAARSQEKLEARVRKLESALTEVKGSASWRVTSPLRRLTQGEGRTPQE